ncbi:MAG: DoxX family membrane protein [Terriglobales bacterium]
MAYTHVRLRNFLALVRIGTGLIFANLGWTKIYSVDYAHTDFPQFMWAAIHGGAPAFYAHFLEVVVWPNTTKYAISFGFLELFIGVSLVLGLLIRPICIAGMGYMVHLMLCTWHLTSMGESVFTFPNEGLRYACPFFVFLILGIGHAGENWGLGTLYHRRRNKQWEKTWQIKMVSGLPPLKRSTPAGESPPVERKGSAD